MATHTLDDLIALKNDVAKRRQMAKEKCEMNERLLEELRAERAETRAAIEQAQRELGLVTEQSAKLAAKMEQQKQKRAADKEAKQKETDGNKHAGMTAEQIHALRDKLTDQRTAVSKLEEEVEALENKKPEYQAAVVEMRAALKQKKEVLAEVSKERTEVVERHEYRVGQCEALVKSVEEVRADINRLHEKLKAPAGCQRRSRPDALQRVPISVQVLAEKKQLEQEVTSISETIAALRNRISQMRDEIEELQGHEFGGSTSVDIDQMVEMMKGFVKDCKEICDAVTVALLEKLEDADRQNRAVVREYDQNCTELVIHECREVHRKLESRFFELESLAAEANRLNEAIRHR
ncbi:hypothetical protein M3Y99_01667900 [Aphelenchoides fujianensis]|nr:hypothetical protein M3Y99_01667900 [Aphelenchoides fujianensis]